MRFIADFHIHSRYSRATSSQLTPEHLAYWSRLKGLQVLGSGDCVHPAWLSELKDKLEPSDNGLYRLKPSIRLPCPLPPRLQEQPVSFLLTTEISSIYKKGGKVRKVHTICVLPDFAAVDRFQARLKKIGNIASDGRPILGLDCKALLEMVLESGPQAYAIPAHIWTPWFSLLGSNSGFDSLEECFEDLAPEIFAVETGLSSDPPMNRSCRFLDGVRLVSNSDAHSPEKLGREANLFDASLSYGAIYEALKHDRGFEGTIEFFPQEGKYHYDGHRNCGVRWNPLETITRRGVCSACGKPVTRGVMYRVAELADRLAPETAPAKQRFYSITPLPELLAEMLGQRSPTGVTVRREYHRLIERLGPEFHLLLFADLKEIERVGGERLAAGIARLRSGEVVTEEGYDGQFGKIRVFVESASQEGESLFQAETMDALVRSAGQTRSVEFDIEEFQRCRRLAQGAAGQAVEAPGTAPQTDEQQAAIESAEGVWMILAGPGSGKTRILTERVTHLIARREAKPGEILAVTFSNKAAQEIRERVAAKLAAHLNTVLGSGFGAVGSGPEIVDFRFKICDWEARPAFRESKIENRKSKISSAPQPRTPNPEHTGVVHQPAGEVTIATFHALGLAILKEQWLRVGRTPACAILDEGQCAAVLTRILAAPARTVRKTAESISRWKQGGGRSADEEVVAVLARYEQALRERDAVDLDDLIRLPAQLLREHAPLREAWRCRARWILIDEYQDINGRQYELIRRLAGEGDPNLFAIGDPDQAIYGFRGSDVGLIDRLREDYPTLREIRLSRSWRCPETILKGAGQVLEKADHLRGSAEAVKIHIQACATEREEADWIAAKIEAMIGGVRSLSMHSGIAEGHAQQGVASFRDFALLCRTTAMFSAMEEALAHHGIAYQVIGIEPFYRREPWASILRKLRDEQPPGGQSMVDLLRTLMVEAGVPEPDQQRLLEIATAFGDRPGEFLRALAMRQGMDDYSAAAQRVSLMTMHASKGLEFPVVFIPGCEEGLIPFEQFGAKSDAELAEEERLFYVAMTRTKRYLFLTHARKRAWRGAVLTSERSRFLDRLEKALVELGARPPRKRPDAYQPTFFEDPKG